MAFPEGFAKHFGGRLSNLTDSSTDDDIRGVYGDWAAEYDKVRR